MLIIPDIHGRTFWKDAVRDISSYEKVIFLGDYHDPYPFEGITERESIENLKEIFDFTRSNKSKVILLLGNHDIPYYYGFESYSRYDYDNHEELEKLYFDNRDLLLVAYETNRTLFTHAGFLQSWADYVSHMRPSIKIKPHAADLNELLFKDYGKTVIYMPGRSRGGNYPYASFIWADREDHEYNSKYNGKFQVFGHTLQLDTYDYYRTGDPDQIKDGKPVIVKRGDMPFNKKGFAMLDCRHAFEYNEYKRTFVQL